MNFLFAVITVTVAVIVLAGGSPIVYYATKYDHLDVEGILNNRRMVKYYANCLLSKGPCTPQGLELKRILPEAIETNCLRCTEKQKVVTYQSLKRLKKEYPKTWALLQAKWDPKNIYVKKFEETFKQKPSSTTPENEIIIENRFGDADENVSKPPTTKATEDRKPTTLPASSPKTSSPKTTRPSINSIGMASENKPTSIPSIPNNQSASGTPVVNVTNQVGSGNQDEGGNKRQLTNSVDFVQTSSTPRYTSVSTIFIPPSSTQTSVTRITGVTFDIPKSSLNHTQTQQLLQQNPASPTTGTITQNPSSPRQPDPISHLVFSFLNANKPSTSKPKTPTTTREPDSPNLQIRLPKISGLIRKAGVRNRQKTEFNTTVQINLRRPLIQVTLPGLRVNNNVDPFNPVGNIVRGIATAGDRLIETGTSIADSVLTSVRGLFDPSARRRRRN